jgi:hypothetical protein
MSDINQINYNALRGIHSIFLKSFLGSFKTKSGIIWFAFLLIVFVSAFLTKNGSILLYSAIIYLIYISVISTKKRNKLWTEFALDNGWTINDLTSIPPSLKLGYSPVFSPAIAANLNGVNCELFNYAYTTGAGRNRHIHEFTIAHVQLPKVLSHMQLFSKRIHAVAKIDLESDHQLKLEGDFNNYFNLHIEAGQQIDVLAVITPEVMQSLITYNTAEDVEIYQNELYFMIKGDKRDVEQTKALINSIPTLSQQIIRNCQATMVNQLAPEVVAPPPIAPATVSAQAQPNTSIPAISTVVQPLVAPAAASNLPLDNVNPLEKS